MCFAPSTQIAAVFEFAGTMAVGRSVVSTIAGNVAKLSAFAKDPGEPEDSALNPEGLIEEML